MTSSQADAALTRLKQAQEQQHEKRQQLRLQPLPLSPPLPSSLPQARPVVVALSAFHDVDERTALEAIVVRLGGCVDNLSLPHNTHVCAPLGKRTEKSLAALTAGKWYKHVSKSHAFFLVLCILILIHHRLLLLVAAVRAGWWAPRG